MGGAVYAANFTQPTQTPPGGNVDAPVNVGATAQAKAVGFGASSLTASIVKGLNEVCIGDDCRDVWPSGGSGDGTDLGSCKIDTKVVYARNSGTTGFAHPTIGTTQGDTLGSLCYNYLTQAEKDQSWTLVSFDNCPGVQGKDCAGAGYCAFMRLSCSDGVTVQNGVTTHQEQPATSGGGSRDPDDPGGPRGGGVEL